MLDQKYKDYLAIFVSIMIGILIILSIYNKYIVRIYEIETNINKEIKIVFISDLHNSKYGDNQSILISEIEKINPHLILIGGDLVDEDSSYDSAWELLEGINSIAPIYYVSGNHEYWTHEITNIKNKIRDFNITILEEEYEKIRINGIDLIIAGIDDPEKKYYKDFSYEQSKSMQNAFGNLDEIEDTYKILIAHRPEEIDEYRKYNFDLILSGHAHGGQVRIPYILNGLYSPNQGFFPKFAGGLYKYDKLNHIVSRGLSFNKNLPRIFNRPELVLVKIK